MMQMTLRRSWAQLILDTFILNYTLFCYLGQKKHIRNKLYEKDMQSIASFFKYWHESLFIKRKRDCIAAASAALKTQEDISETKM